MIGINGHMYPPFKPCYNDVTGGKLDCPHCPHRPHVWQGFLPIYDASGYPVVVLLQEYHIDAAKSLKLHEAVTFKKGGEKYDRIAIVPGKPEHWYRATMPSRQRAADIRHWLIFTLWKRESQLVSHYLANPFTNELPEMERAGLIAPGAASPASVLDPDSDNGVSQAATAKVATPRRPEAKPAGETFDALTERIKRRAATVLPSDNGKHRKGEG